MDFFYWAILFRTLGIDAQRWWCAGFLHLGVVNVLLEQGLLPRVISGSSAGAMVAGVLACHTDEEMVAIRDPAMLRNGPARMLVSSGACWSAVARVSPGRSEQLIERLVPDMTFEEAYAKTGRQVSITIAPAEPHQRSRLLNAITSPNVYTGRL